MKLKKDKRREAIRQQIDSNPFITDHELSDLFQVLSLIHISEPTRHAQISR
ncbi:transcription factor FapR, partial [Staphylococcus aureus]|nr:transcription factor FapR [Staphylococcus aureus]